MWCRQIRIVYHTITILYTVNRWLLCCLFFLFVSIVMRVHTSGWCSTIWLSWESPGNGCIFRSRFCMRQFFHFLPFHSVMGWYFNEHTVSTLLPPLSIRLICCCGSHVFDCYYFLNKLESWKKKFFFFLPLHLFRLSRFYV